MIDWKYLPTLAELIDKLSIVILKSIFIPEYKEAYEKEQEFIMHDIDLILQIHDCKEGDMNTIIVNARMIRAILILMLTNREIWLNESKARAGGSEQDKLLKFTHSVNGIRSTAKNIISQEMGERIDLKVDCLAAELVKEFGNWNIF
jgi:hypothetical protein